MSPPAVVGDSISPVVPVIVVNLVRLAEDGPHLALRHAFTKLGDFAARLWIVVSRASDQRGAGGGDR